MQGDGGWAALDGRDNALNFLRLAFATCVVISHSLLLTVGFSGLSFWLGRIAVLGFFAISGYLVTGSRMRTEAGPFLWRRALRILPGLWACLLVTAFVFAPVAARVTGAAYDAHEAASYVATNGTLVFASQPTIGETLGATSDAWNESLWTLPWEVICYLVCGVLMAFPMMRRPVVVAGGLVAAAATALLAWNLLPTVGQHAVHLGSLFAAGALLRLTRDRVPLSGRLAVGGAALVFVAFSAPVSVWVALFPLPLAYLVLWLGAHLPVRVGAVNDISYGVYIYGSPIMQLAVVFGAASVAPGWFAVGAVAAALVAGWVSWVLVERPAMRLRRLVSRPKRPASRAPSFAD